MKELPTRKSIRLKGYDYATIGYYFVTFCVKGMHELLWDTSVGAHSVRPLSPTGSTTEKAIEMISQIYDNIRVDKYVIMPNHIHMILCIKDNGRTLCAPTTVSRIVKQCKEYITKQIGHPIWQKSFHDHIIRTKAEYQRIWQYIDQTPTNWTEDCYYPQSTPERRETP